jgi:hypothetical protein
LATEAKKVTNRPTTEEIWGFVKSMVCHLQKPVSYAVRNNGYEGGHQNWGHDIYMLKQVGRVLCWSFSVSALVDFLETSSQQVLRNLALHFIFSNQVCLHVDHVSFKYGGPRPETRSFLFLAIVKDTVPISRSFLCRLF